MPNTRLLVTASLLAAITALMLLPAMAQDDPPHAVFGIDRLGRQALNLQRSHARSEDVHVVLQHGRVLAHCLDFGSADDGRREDGNRIARAAQPLDDVPSHFIQTALARKMFGRLDGLDLAP